MGKATLSLLSVLTVSSVVAAQGAQFRYAVEHALTSSIGSFPRAVADVDGNGFPDVLDAGTVVRNYGLGNYRIDPLPRSQQIPWAQPIVGDYDGDGDVDVVVTSGNFFGPWVVELATNDGFGNFALVPNGITTSLAQPNSGGFAEDLDADGDVDVVLATSLGIDVLVNDGTGRLVSSGALASGIAIASIAAFDADGDRDLDFAVAYSDPMSTADGLWINDGTGSFSQAPAGTLTPAPSQFSVFALDVDEDGRTDVLYGPNTQLLRQTPTGFVDATSILPPLNGTLYGAAMADIDLDGDRDLLLSALTQSVGVYPRVFLSGPPGTFTDATLARVDASVFQIAGWTTRLTQVADWDLDGDPDWLVVGSIGGTSLGVVRLLTNHHRQLTPAPAPIVGQTYRLDLDARPGYATTSKTAFGMISTGRVNMAVPGLGVLQLDPAGLIALPPVSIPASTGQASTTIAVPNDPTLAGGVIAVQALLADPESPASPLTLTNAWVRSIN